MPTAPEGRSAVKKGEREGTRAYGVKGTCSFLRERHTHGVGSAGK